MQESYRLNWRPRGTLSTNPSSTPAGTSTTTFLSSANTPQFPSAFGVRPAGVGTHFDYPEGLNSHLAATQPSLPAVERARLASLKLIDSLQRSQVALRPEQTDQGPAGPAPQSNLEYAGWLEYLALLFGDAGNATAVRLILQRLTHLAQLQANEGEAQKVQAACAFLAAHFQPLLESVYRQ